MIDISFELTSNQSGKPFSEAFAKEEVILSCFFNLSVKEILSPGDAVKDGMLTFLSLTLMPLCLIICQTLREMNRFLLYIIMNLIYFQVTAKEYHP